MFRSYWPNLDIQSFIDAPQLDEPFEELFQDRAWLIFPVNEDCEFKLKVNDPVRVLVFCPKASQQIWLPMPEGYNRLNHLTKEERQEWRPEIKA